MRVTPCGPPCIYKTSILFSTGACLGTRDLEKTTETRSDKGTAREVVGIITRTLKRGSGMLKRHILALNLKCV